MGYLKLFLVTILKTGAKISFLDHYEALGRLLDLLRRAGKLEECDKFLEQVSWIITYDEIKYIVYAKKTMHYYYDILGRL